MILFPKAQISLSRPRFDLGPHHVRCMVGEVAWGKAFSSTVFFACQYHSKYKRTKPGNHRRKQFSFKYHKTLNR